MEWFTTNANWIFSGIGVSIGSAIAGWIGHGIRHGKRRHVDPVIRKLTVADYPDPRLKIEKKGDVLETEHYLLFNRAMLKDKSVHAVKFEISKYKDEDGSVSQIATMHETFGAKKDFVIIDQDDVTFAYGEGGVDWSVWVVKRNSVGGVKTIYGSMVYYGFEKGFVGSASLFLLKVEEASFKGFEPRYIPSEQFDASFPYVSAIIDKRNSKIVADFRDLADTNVFDVRDEVAKNLG